MHQVFAHALTFTPPLSQVEVYYDLVAKMAQVTSNIRRFPLHYRTIRVAKRQGAKKTQRCKKSAKKDKEIFKRQ